MEVVDLSPEFEPAYLACLEEWSDEMSEAGDRKTRWLGKMRDRGLRVKLALDDDRRPVMTSLAFQQVVEMQLQSTQSRCQSQGDLLVSRDP